MSGSRFQGFLYENVSKPLNFKAKPASEAKAGGALRWVPYITLALFLPQQVKFCSNRSEKV